MARQQTQIRLDSVPAFLNRHLDQRRARRNTAAPERRKYLAHRSNGRVPISMAQRFMNLVHHGLGTYTDELGMPWYRDGDTIVRVTENLDWIEQKASQGDIPKNQRRTAQRRRGKRWDVEWWTGEVWELIPDGENVDLDQAEKLGYAFRQAPQFRGTLEMGPEIRVIEHKEPDLYAKRRTAQDIKDNSENANVTTNVPSSSGDYELPQDRGYNTRPPRRKKKHTRR